MTLENEWWRGCVIYQIYIRSFFDSNNDGIGDIPGITAKMDYIASLGVDAIWLTPMFLSPMKDFGYDVSDYRTVDPIFGTLDDFKTMATKAHDLGLKVMIDKVLSHTSDQHEWFQQSRQNKTNPKADWYVWADPKADGSPPNNWLSIFGGPAWQWSSMRQQYYLHNFLESQPDLNIHNPEVEKQLLEEVEFWFQQGVDGIRLDTVNYYLHDPQLRDNPPKSKVDGELLTNPYHWQEHLYDKSRPENIQVLQKMRSLMKQYPGTTSLGEIGDEHALRLMAEYTSGNDKLHMAYSFRLLGEKGGAAFIRNAVEELEQQIDDGWPSWVMSNHDTQRVASRWALDGKPNVDDYKPITLICTSCTGLIPILPSKTPWRS